MNVDIGDLATWYAAIVATVALALTGFQTWRDRANVKIRLFGTTVAPGGTPIHNLVAVEAANRGRRPVKVTGFSFACTDGTRFTIFPYPAPFNGTALPAKLGEGDHYIGLIPLHRLQEAVQAKPPKVRLGAVAFKAADGRTFRWRIPRRDPMHKQLRGPLAPEPEHQELLDPSKSKVGVWFL